MRHFKSIITISIIIFLYKCSTPYQPKGMMGGYSEEKIIKNMYRVEFEGNQHSKPENIQNYLLYRCAELTKDLGYDYFMVVNEERHFDKYSARQESAVPGMNRGSASGGTRVVANPDFQNPTSSTNYTGIYTIKLLEDIDDKYKNSVFNADEVMTELSSMIKK